MYIRTFDDPVLRATAAPIRRISASVRRLASQMAETMKEYRGVGLAAPQVGVLSRLVVVDVGDGIHVLANPRVISSEGSSVDWEGCLSFPGLLAQVERAAKVTVEATDLSGKTIWVEGQDYFARALQHEIDHLDGIVILDRATAVEKIPPAETTEVEPREEAGPAPEGEFTPAPEGESAPARRSLRVAFLGTPSFAVPTLEAILRAGYQVVGVATQPDRPAGRGGKATRPPAVKEAALEHGLPLWQGDRDEARSSLGRLIRVWGADVAVVVAYGVLLPREVLAAPRLGCINLHASLLPDYRGAAPIQRALMDGRTITGVSVIQMDEGMDTGDILAQREIEISSDDTAGSLHDRLSTIGADLVVHVLDLLARGSAAPRPQPGGPRPTAPRLTPEDEVVDWNRSAQDIALKVRALDPTPGAHTVFRGERVKLWKVEPAPGPAGRTPAGRAPVRPGEVVSAGEEGLVVATGRGLLTLGLVQPAGRARMSGSAFVNGYRVKPGELFGV